MAESVTVTVKSEVPAEFGVPEMRPVVPFRVRSPGSVPDEMIQKYDPEPPVAVNWPLYGVVTVASGSVSEVMRIEPVPATCMVSDWVAVLGGVDELETRTVKVLVMLAEVGVPEMIPDEFNVSPAGSVPEVRAQE